MNEKFIETISVSNNTQTKRLNIIFYSQTGPRRQIPIFANAAVYAVYRPITSV